MTNPTRKTDPADAIEFHRGAFLTKLRRCLGGATGDFSGVMDDLDAAVRQAREDTFNTVRDALRHTQADDRWTFLQYCLTGWVESGMTGFFLAEYESGRDDADLRNIPGLEPNAERIPARALVINQGDDYLNDTAVKKILASGKVCANCGTPLPSTKPCPRNLSEHKPEQAVFEVTHETIELGLQRIRHAVNIPDAGSHPEQRNQTSVKYLGQGLRNSIIEADLTHDAGQLDVWGYSMIVEVAIFGEGMYA